MKYVFFGTAEPAAEILEILKTKKILPTLVVTNPDKPEGRKQVLTPSPVKVWANENHITVFQPETFDEETISKFKENVWDLFIVVAYGKIIPKSVIDIPKNGCINVHYSLLPKYRGASPVESQILADDREAGVTIMLIDEKMDHGPILASSKVEIENWPPTSKELRTTCNKVAGETLTEIIPKLISGKINPVEQDHAAATYTKKFKTEDGEIDLKGDEYKNFLKFQAMNGWIPVFFFVEKNNKRIRIIVKKAIYADGEFQIERVVPEGKKEMDYKDFVKGYL